MRRIPELDSLRGVAAVGVVLFHAFPNVVFIGWCFVDLFFVLSGFLITSIVLMEGRARGFAKVFYFRRAIRIWPVYYATLAAVLALNALSRTGHSTAGLPYNLVFLQNIQGYWFGAVPEFPASFNPSWSVAVEEQFYMIWPLLVLALGGPRAVVPLAGLLLSLSISMRCYGFNVNMLATRFDGLVMGGVLAALLLDRERAQANRSRLDGLFLTTGGLASAFVAAYIWTWWGSPLLHWRPLLYTGFGLFFFSVLGLVILHTGDRRLAALRWKPLMRLGLLSYAMYMTHNPIFHFTPTILERFGLRSQGLVTFATWTLVLAVPVASYFLLEQPILSLRRLVRYPDPPETSAARDPILVASPGIVGE